MFFLKKRSLVFLGILAFLGGCSWKATPPPAEPTPQELSPVLQFMVSNATGATSIIDDAQFGGEVRVTLEDTFLSAAGETCKRATLVSGTHEAEVVVICKTTAEDEIGTTPDENWRLMPRVWGRGILPSPK